MSRKDLLYSVIGSLGIFGLLVLFTLPRSEPPVQNPQTNLSTPTTDASSSAELKVEDLVVGQGTEAKSGSTVTVNYIGTLTDGTKFDSSYDAGQPFTTQIGNGSVIKGWDEGIPGMKVGGKRRLTIPSELGYGPTGAGDKIPPNSTLIFEIELLEVK